MTRPPLSRPRSSGSEPQARLTAAGVGFAYGPREVLRGVGLEVTSGECVALLGANGAGKTTLLRLLAGLDRPGSGSVALDGMPVADLGAAERARRIGYLPQLVPAGTGFAAYEIVLMGMYPLLPARGWESRREWMAVGRALRRVGAGGLLRRSFDRLSGGEQRRVLLARALVTRPAVLLLDEPLAALDPGFALELTDTLAALKRQGVALVVSTHRLALAHSLADRVAILRAGRTLVYGPPAAALDPAMLDAAYDTDRFSARAAHGAPLETAR